ncbi:GNAT family N-acetyltransferase [Flavobacterium sp. MMLR14_040]|uniref:GNAT family N-acetyltransferase n=1 Tax=Flavobacterium sp. MMLR14_040 TaxID=3093843 RepID=UPI00298F716A|nr:GNAT family N-acetyltransferase [Flavobacterium sp. MMLR14_040]MDW8849275.1 GNAT family N-acetyltransferase [Flavobacterium sp. MMLR14_040]
MLSFKKASLADMKLYFEWANDSIVREQSYNSGTIDFENHENWFRSKLSDNSCMMVIFENEENLKVGQIRIQKESDYDAVIGISIALEHRGKSYGKEMLEMATDFFLRLNPNFTINAFIKETNLSSKNVFEKAGFKFKEMRKYENFNSFHYIKKEQNENR